MIFFFFFFFFEGNAIKSLKKTQKNLGPYYETYPLRMYAFFPPFLNCISGSWRNCCSLRVCQIIALLILQYMDYLVNHFVHVQRHKRHTYFTVFTAYLFVIIQKNDSKVNSPWKCLSLSISNLILFPWRLSE